MSHESLSVKAVSELIKPIISRTLTGSLPSRERLLVRSLGMKQLRVGQLLLYILYLVLEDINVYI